MSERERDFRRIQIPENASLKEIIQLLNMNWLEIDLNHPDVKAWVYEHQDWIVPKGAKP